MLNTKRRPLSFRVSQFDTDVSIKPTRRISSSGVQCGKCICDEMDENVFWVVKLCKNDTNAIYLHGLQIERADLTIILQNRGKKLKFSLQSATIVARFLLRSKRISLLLKKIQIWCWIRANFVH